MTMPATEFKAHMVRLCLVSAKEAADLFGVNPRTIYAWETLGCTNKSATMLLRIAAEMGWSADDIRRLSGKAPETE